VLAGVVGLLFVGSGSLNTTGHTVLVVPALGAALLGGLTSIPLAVAGGLALGMFQAGMVQLTQRSWWPDVLPPAGVREAIPLLVIGGYLYLKGAGLPVRGTVTERRLPRAPEPKNVLVGAAVPIVIALLLSGVFTTGWEVALTTSILATLLMLSWVVITGYLGQISLVQLSLAGVAAYTAARLSADVEKVSQLGAFTVTGPNLPDPLAALLGVAAAVVLGVLIGLPAVRIRGVQLAVVTLAASAPIGLLLLRNGVIFGDVVESDYPVPRPNWFGAYVGAADPNTARTDYWRFTVFAVLVTALVAVAVAGLRRGATGRRFLAVRANERAAAATGINVARTKLTGFAIAAGIAGLAGVLHSYRLGSIRTDTYGLFVGLALFAFVYLGGITSVYGAIIGGLMVSGGLIANTVNTHAGGAFEQYVPVVAAIGLIATAILHPEGIALANAEIGKKLWHRLRGTHAVRPLETRSTLESAPVGGR
jgi:branched-chain amino acid transport system permease protein